MTTKLRIKNFKKISEEITLLNFAKVNYFVGPNSSGKTSVLNAISFLTDGSNSRLFFRENSVVEFTTDDGKQYLQWDESDPNKVTHKGNLRTVIFVPKEEFIEKGANGTHTLPFHYAEFYKESFDFFNNTLEKLGGSKMTVERIIKNDNPWDSTAGNRVVYHDNTDISSQYLAQGHKAFNSFRYLLENLFSEARRKLIEPAHIVIVILEEPENNLHPTLQKKIPEYLDAFFTDDDPLKNKIHFLIATHSPFIIGASANYSDQKVYLLDQGRLCDLEGAKTLSSEGYHGNQCAWIVGQMLGAEVTDLGYPENYCIVEEYSLQIILEYSRAKGIVKNYQFVSASGESNVIKINDRIDNIEKLNTLIKCNPYYFDKYLVIVDNTKDFSPKQKERFEKLENKLGNRFMELSKHSLEDYYKNINPELAAKCEQELIAAKGDHGKTGLIKAAYARKICESLNDTFDFLTLFDLEMDQLLK